MLGIRTWGRQMVGAGMAAGREFFWYRPPFVAWSLKSSWLQLNFSRPDPKVPCFDPRQWPKSFIKSLSVESWDNKPITFWRIIILVMPLLYLNIILQPYTCKHVFYLFCLHSVQRVLLFTVKRSCSPLWPDLAKFRHFGKILSVISYLAKCWA